MNVINHGREAVFWAGEAKVETLQEIFKDSPFSLKFENVNGSTRVYASFKGVRV